MSKTSGFDIDLSSFGAGIAQLSALNRRSQTENLFSFARTTLTNPSHSGLIDITPPASEGVTGTAARQQGEAAIARDLAQIFVGVRIKGKRPEQFPDPESIHSRLFAGKRPGAKLRSDRGRQKYYVDKEKLRVLFQKLKGRVGRLASAWLVSAHRLGVTGPAWVERHGAGDGYIKVDTAGPTQEIEMVIYAPDNAPIDELERRVAYALDYTQGRVERAVEGALAAAAAKSGFRVSA